MKKPIFTGCATAIVTPFGTAGPDLGALGNLLDFQLENGADAIVVLQSVPSFITDRNLGLLRQ